MDYSSLIPYKVKDLVAKIIVEKNLSFVDAIKYLYESQLYERLSEEKTKFWHFSTAKLFDMLEIEKQTQVLDIP